uniref:Uncharacterized protein n=1 Tax=Arundo donax TaxID=35708 RepID=A0A0A9E1Z7_ARUDO
MPISMPAKEGMVVVVDHGGPAAQRTKQAQARPRKADLTTSRRRRSGVLIALAGGEIMSM